VIYWQVETVLRLRRFDARAAVWLGQDAHDEFAGSGFGGQRLRDGFALRTNVLGQVVDQVPGAGYRLPGSEVRCDRLGNSVQVPTHFASSSGQNTR
jgi:hypothetical protein